MTQASMDSPGEENGVPLHSVASTSVEGYKNTVRSVPLEISDNTVLRRYKQLSVDVYTQHSYAAVSEGPLPPDFEYGDFSQAYGHRYRGEDTNYNWIPAYSGQKFRSLLCVAPGIVLLLRYAMSVWSLKSKPTIVASIAPSIIGTLLASMTVTIVAAEIRRENYQLQSSSHAATQHRQRLNRHRWLVLYLLAPLLSIPLWTMRHVSTASRLTVFRPQIKLYSFSSWEKAAQHIRSHIPINRAVGPNFPALESSEDAWNSWRISVNGTAYASKGGGRWLEPAPVLEFEGNSVFDWGEALAGEVLFMPLYSTNDQRPSPNTVSMAIRAPMWALSPHINCFLLNQTKPWPLYTEVTMEAEENCEVTALMTTVPLEGKQREDLAKVYESEIEEVERYLETHTSGTRAGKNRERLTRLRQERLLLVGNEPLKVSQPSWNAWNTVGDKECTRGLFFVGDNKPFRYANETEIPRWELSGASCFTTFSILVRMMTLNLPRHTLIKGLNPLPVNKREPDLGGLSRSALHLTSGWPESLGRWTNLFNDFSVPDAWIWSLWLKPETDEAKPLSTAINGWVRYVNVLDTSIWPKQLLQYGRYDSRSVMTAEYDIAALALGSKTLAAWIAEQMSESATLALSELSKKISESRSWTDRFLGVHPSVREIRAELITTHFERGNTMTLWAKLLCVLLVLACTGMAGGSNLYSNDAPSGLPWSINSIAARAALLSRSRLNTFFSSAGRVPTDVRAIPGLKLGYWARDEGHSHYTWHLDSMCNEIVVNQKGQDEREFSRARLWQRHSMRSLPLSVHPVILGIRLILFFALVIVALTLGGRREPVTIPNTYIAAMLSEDLLIYPGLWNDLDEFYSTRQPWANLANPDVAWKNLTLDYIGCKWRLWMAFRNKDFIIVLLSISTSLSLLLPAFIAGTLRLETKCERIETVDGKHNFSWNFQLTTLNSITKPPGNMDWVIKNEAMIPIELDQRTDTAPMTPGAFWQARTTSLRSNLTCFPPTYTIHSFYNGNNGNDQLRHPEKIVIDLSNMERFIPGLRFDDGTRNRTLSLCKGNQQHLQGSALQKNRFICWDWTLLSITYDKVFPNSENIWAISVIEGDVDVWDPHYGFMLKREFLTKILLCEPSTFLSNGTVELVELDNVSTGETTLEQRRFKIQDVEKVEVDDLRQFDLMLNNTIAKNGIEIPGALVPHDVIATSTFVGDLMGYLSYQILLTHEPTQRDGQHLDVELYASMLYSKVFAFFVAHNDWCRLNVTTAIQVDKMQWSELWRVRKIMLILTLILISFFGFVGAYLSRKRREYLFPIAPEPLENSLFFLYQSGIIKRMETIRHPERMTINELHREVTAFGGRYTFGIYEDTDEHYVGFGVDRVDEPGFQGTKMPSTQKRKKKKDSTPTRYRDEEDLTSESSTSSDDSESTRLRPSRRAKYRKNHRKQHDTANEDLEELDHGNMLEDNAENTQIGPNFKHKRCTSVETTDDDANNSKINPNNNGKQRVNVENIDNESPEAPNTIGPPQDEDTTGNFDDNEPSEEQNKDKPKAFSSSIALKTTKKPLPSNTSRPNLLSRGLNQLKDLRIYQFPSVKHLPDPTPALDKTRDIGTTQPENSAAVDGRGDESPAKGGNGVVSGNDHMYEPT
ncbi:hypothetical protein K505DRAFT_395886 [Melanomma pulvis-pyrius CBS 109.77]|uniref:Uncharacterized protein n=1 Tax=Melanomma pulvis-pyrius CBS 109.77 TaxID=1314802 RepID=A0A6A6WVJ1_9PLEO|nr:hypothetical protein K505DRAFT_395886 [Melanomma pulvis-pyrius CBS 109.77]